MHEPGPTRDVHHVGLTVPDLEAARRFFVDELGYAVRAEKPEYPAVFVSDGTTLITLWQAEDPEHAVPFDRRRNVGLHHLAIAVNGPLRSMHCTSGSCARDGPRSSSHRNRSAAVPCGT